MGSEEVGHQETEPLSLTAGGRGSGVPLHSYCPLLPSRIPSDSFFHRPPPAPPTSPPSFLKEGHAQTKCNEEKSCLFPWQWGLGLGGGHPRPGVAAVGRGAVMPSRQRSTE